MAALADSPNTMVKFQGYHHYHGNTHHFEDTWFAVKLTVFTSILTSVARQNWMYPQFTHLEGQIDTVCWLGKVIHQTCDSSKPKECLLEFCWIFFPLSSQLQLSFDRLVSELRLELLFDPLLVLSLVHFKIVSPPASATTVVLWVTSTRLKTLKMMFRVQHTR